LTHSDNHTDRSHNDRPATSDFHPVVYMALVGLVLWLMIAIWAFARDDLSSYLMVIVIGFIALVVAIPSTLVAMARSSEKPADANDHELIEPQEHRSFREWAAGEVDIWQDRVKGSSAAFEALLPIAALAVGMTAFAVVSHYTLHTLPPGA